MHNNTKTTQASDCDAIYLKHWRRDLEITLYHLTRIPPAKRDERLKQFRKDYAFTLEQWVSAIRDPQVRLDTLAEGKAEFCKLWKRWCRRSVVLYPEHLRDQLLSEGEGLSAGYIRKRKLGLIDWGVARRPFGRWTGPSMPSNAAGALHKYRGTDRWCAHFTKDPHLVRDIVPHVDDDDFPPDLLPIMQEFALLAVRDTTALDDFWTRHQDLQHRLFDPLIAEYLAGTAVREQPTRAVEEFPQEPHREEPVSPTGGLLPTLVPVGPHDGQQQPPSPPASFNSVDAEEQLPAPPPEPRDEPSDVVEQLPPPLAPASAVVPPQDPSQPSPSRRSRKTTTIPRDEKARAMCLNIQDKELRFLVKLYQAERRERGEPFISQADMIQQWGINRNILYETHNLGRVIGFTVEKDEFIGHNALGRPTVTYERKGKLIVIPPEQFLKRITPGEETPDQTRARRDRSSRPHRSECERLRTAKYRADIKARRRRVADLDCRASAIREVLIPGKWMTIKAIAREILKSKSPSFNGLTGNSLYRAIARELDKKSLRDMILSRKKATARCGFSVRAFRLK